MKVVWKYTGIKKIRFQLSLFPTGKELTEVSNRLSFLLKLLLDLTLRISNFFLSSFLINGGWMVIVLQETITVNPFSVFFWIFSVCERESHYENDDSNNNTNNDSNKINKNNSKGWLSWYWKFFLQCAWCKVVSVTMSLITSVRANYKR